MLYIFHGTDSKKSGDKARALVGSLRSKKPDATFIEMDRDSWNPAIVKEHALGQGLFSNKYIVFLNEVATDEDKREELIESLSFMKESPNIFILYEGKVNAELKKAFDKKSDKIVVTDKEEGKKSEFNIFSLADALGARDRFKSWAIYRQAIQNGQEPEAVLGTIFWQVKSMYLASNTKSASESGLNPFVFSKAKRSCGNYSPDELKNLMNQSVVLYHDSHRGSVDLELGIEKMLLEI